jgi:hypothetical protein
MKEHQMSDKPASEGSAMINWQEVLEWAERVEENRRAHNEKEDVGEDRAVVDQGQNQAAE